MSKITPLSKKINLIESFFGEGIVTRDSKNISVKCPKCKFSKSEKKKLSIDIKSGMYHCWVCETKGSNVGYFCLKLDNNEVSNNLYKVYKKKNDSLLEKKPEQQITLPTDFLHLGSYLKEKGSKKNFSAEAALKYLKSRDFSYEDLWKFNPGLSDKYKDFVLFPSFDKNLELNFYTCRIFNEKSKYKYKNCQGQKKDIIYNEHLVNFKKELIIVEGIFDLVKCRNMNATCLLGSWMDENYKIFNEIVKHNTSIVLCLDFDAKSKSIKIIEKLKSYCVNVRIAKDSRLDFGDMSQKDVLNTIRNAKAFKNMDRIRYLINDIKSGSIY